MSGAALLNYYAHNTVERTHRAFATGRTRYGAGCLPPALKPPGIVGNQQYEVKRLLIAYSWIYPLNATGFFDHKPDALVVLQIKLGRGEGLGARFVGRLHVNDAH